MAVPTPSPPAISIFFDLETSDLEPIGQILNFCFIAVDRKWHPIDELSGSIRVSRLQLPRASAIAANRINLQEHQRTAHWNEAEAMREIDAFLQRMTSTLPKWSVPLIGYNSSRFDLLHLRTSLIRNGINPYYPVVYRDLLQTVQTLCLRNSEFEALRCTTADHFGGEVSQKLEFIARCMGTLEGIQLHESRADVVLTIDTARCIAERFTLDVRSFESYELRPLHRESKGTAIEAARLSSRAEWRPFTFHAGTDRSAIWLDLQHYKEGGGGHEAAHAALRWISCTTQGFLLKQRLAGEWHILAVEALAHVKGVTLENYFPEATCDIEQFIYRISPGHISSMAQHFSRRKSPENWTEDMRVLHRRYRLANYEMGSGSDDAVRGALADYARYRYGGKLQLAKTLREDPIEGAEQRQFHVTLSEMFDELDQLRQGCAEPETRELLDSVEAFYKQSEIYSLIGGEVLPPPQRAACQNSA